MYYRRITSVLPKHLQTLNSYHMSIQTVLRPPSRTRALTSIACGPRSYKLINDLPAFDDADVHHYRFGTINLIFLPSIQAAIVSINDHPMGVPYFKKQKLSC